MSAAESAVVRTRGVVAALIHAIENCGAAISTELDKDVWETLILLRQSDRDLDAAEALAAAGASVGDTYSGASLDTWVYGRGLLYWALEFGVRADLIDSDEQLRRYLQPLGAGELPKVEVIIAYLDHLGTKDESFAYEAYSAIGRKLEASVRFAKGHCYFWRSSDSYYVFTPFAHGVDRAEQVLGFLSLLIDLQNAVRLHGTGMWEWQIGVAVADPRLVADIVHPNEGTYRAATLMNKAKIRRRGGGLIVCDSGIWHGDATSFRAALRAHGCHVKLQRPTRKRPNTIAIRAP